MTSASPAQLSWPRGALRQLIDRPPGQTAALDGLRAIAVLLVICSHWDYEWAVIAHLPPQPMARLPLFYWGWTGVDLFFVLSGFLIGKQLWAELLQTGGIAVPRFILRRGLRIWPLYFFSMLALLVIPSVHAPQWPDWVMLSNYIPTRYARSWSLSTEEQFYVLIPVTLLAISKVVSRASWPACIAALVAAVTAARYLTAAHLTSNGLAPQQVMNAMYSPFHLHCESLQIGLLVARVAPQKPQWLSTPSDTPIAWRVIGVAAVAIVLAAVLRSVSREAFAYLALGLFYGAILAVAVADRSILTAVLRWGAWYPIARLSFGMYLNHLILREPTDTIIAAVTYVFGPASPVAFLAGLVLTVAGSALMAAITFVLVEQPGLQFRERLLRTEAHGVPIEATARV